jgi:hypothetical protein
MLPRVTDRVVRLGTLARRTSLLRWKRRTALCLLLRCDFSLLLLVRRRVAPTEPRVDTRWPVRLRRSSRNAANSRPPLTLERRSLLLLLSRILWRDTLLWTIVRISRIGSWMRWIVSWRDVPPTGLDRLCRRHLTVCWIALRWLLGIPLLLLLLLWRISLLGL